MTRKIGIVCCSDGFNRAYEGEIEELHRILADMGIESVISPFLYARDGVASGTAEERAKAVMDFYLDDTIDAICDISGGDIANGILPYLDYSVIPKMAEVIGSMPSAIIGGVSFMLYGMISAIGVRNVVENHVDFTKSRNLIIAGVIFVCGLGFSNGLTFTVAGTDITLTSLAIAAIAGILLNAILPGNDYHFGKDVEADSNRGIDMIPNLHEDTSYEDHDE